MSGEKARAINRAWEKWPSVDVETVAEIVAAGWDAAHAVQQPNREQIIAALDGKLVATSGGQSYRPLSMGEREQFADAILAALPIPATGDVLAMLDDLNASGGIAYDDYSRLHDAVARLSPEADEAEPVYELFPGTREALDALTIRPEVTP